MNLRFNINLPADFVFDHLTDMQKFTSVHPVISKIDKTGIDSYLIHETLNFFSIPFSFSYPVIVDHTSIVGRITFHSVVMKFIKIKMSFLITPYNDQTVIEEDLAITSVWPINLIIQCVIEKQHKQLFQNLGKVKRLK